MVRIVILRPLNKVESPDLRFRNSSKVKTKE